MRYWFIILFIGSLYSCSSLPQQKIVENNPAVAHRGAWKNKELPKNSIAALRHAIELGCAGSEFDVRMTADSVLVIHHDSEFQGVKIENSSYKDLLNFHLSNGEELPTLKDFIEAGIRNNRTTGLVCEIKPVASKETGRIIAAKVLTLVQNLGAESYISSYISFDYGILTEIERLDPDARTQYLGGDKSPDEIKESKLSGLDYYIDVYRKHPEWINRAKKLHLLLNAWTVDKPEDQQWLINNGFDYITTNEPELLLTKNKKNK